MQAGGFEYDETIYAPPIKMDASIVEVKHGTGEKSKVDFTMFTVQINEVLDQKTPRPDVFEDQEHEEYEPGDVLTIYSRRDFNADKKAVSEAMAVLIGLHLDRPEITARHLKCPVDRNTGEFILEKAKDREAMETFIASFDVLKKDGSIKTSNTDFFEGVRVIIDVFPKTDADGNPKKFTSYTFSRPDGAQ